MIDKDPRREIQIQHGAPFSGSHFLNRPACSISAGWLIVVHVQVVLLRLKLSRCEGLRQYVRPVEPGLDVFKRVVPRERFDEFNFNTPVFHFRLIRGQRYCVDQRLGVHVLHSFSQIDVHLTQQVLRQFGPLCVFDGRQ